MHGYEVAWIDSVRLATDQIELDLAYASDFSQVKHNSNNI